MAPVSNLDLKRVCEFLKMESGLLFWQLSESSPWMWQLNLGLGPKQGNLQFFPTKFGQVSGNCRLNIGTVEWLKHVRALLLKSAWLKDACGSASLSVDQVASAVYQPGGAVLLPHIPANAKVEDVETILKSVYSLLGSAGKTAMTTYLEESGLDTSSNVGQMIDRVFKDRSKSTAGSTRVEDSHATGRGQGATPRAGRGVGGKCGR